MRAKNAIIMKAVQIKDRQVAKSYLILLPKLIQNLYNKTFWIIKVLEGLPNLLRGFREGFTIKTSIVVEGSL